MRYFLQSAAAADCSAELAVRGLRDYFEIAEVHHGGDVRYHLVGWAGRLLGTGPLPISARLRAEVLAPARCAQCGRTPVRHGVVLTVNLRVPPDWGGTNDPENLQPLCEECQDGRRQYLQTYSAYADRIRHAASFDEPQKRIGELLRTFNGDWVPSDLIGIVASAKEYQEDYQRRIRDLRYLGWDYEQQKRHHEGARVKVYYRSLACQHPLRHHSGGAAAQGEPTVPMVRSDGAEQAH